MKTITTKKSIWQSPAIRIILGLSVCFIAFIVAQQSGRILELTALGKNSRNLLKGIISSIAVIAVYIWFFKRYEKRKVTEFSNKGLAKNIMLVH